MSTEFSDNKSEGDASRRTGIPTVYLPAARIDRATPVALTTVFDQGTDCLNRWKLSSANTIHASDFGSDSLRISGSHVQTYDFIVFKTLPKSTALQSVVSTVFDGNAVPFDSFEVSCQPRDFQSYYSPGVCPDQHTIDAITLVLATDELANVVTTEYLATCCQRYVYSVISLHMKTHH